MHMHGRKRIPLPWSTVRASALAKEAMEHSKRKCVGQIFYWLSFNMGDAVPSVIPSRWLQIKYDFFFIFIFSFGSCIFIPFPTDGFDYFMLIGAFEYQ